jgi:Peptidase inhibitor family I36
MRRRLAKVVTVLTALLGVLMFQAGAVSAATPGAGSGRVDNTTCPVGDFCVWPTPDYTGQRVTFAACGTDFKNPYVGFEAGSWKNDQTPQGSGGPVVKMLFSDKSVVYTTPPPWSASSDFSWSGLYYFRVC